MWQLAEVTMEAVMLAVVAVVEGGGSLSVSWVLRHPTGFILLLAPTGGLLLWPRHQCSVFSSRHNASSTLLSATMIRIKCYDESCCALLC